jgi:class 3 adenylate cyclase
VNVLRLVAPRFDDPAEETAFRVELARETVPVVRVGFVLGIPLWIVVAIALPGAAFVDRTLLGFVAGGMVIVDAVSLWAVRGTPSLARLEVLGTIGTIANALAILILTLSAPISDRYTLPGLMLTALYAVVVFRIRMPWAVVPAGAILLAYVVAVGRQTTSGRIAFDALLLTSVLAIGIIAVVVLEMASRSTFRQRRTIEDQREQVAREQAKSDALLRTILPEGIIERLRERREPVADRHEATTLLFADLVGFTGMSERLGPARTAALLNTLVSRWDVLAAEAGVEKIKTIGDAYFAAAGVPEPRADHATRIVDLAFAMIRATAELSRTTGEPLAIRVGVHSGPVVAGVIGRTKFGYDLWGDTVNVAARLEETGVPGVVHASGATVALLADAYLVDTRGEVELKGKGRVTTFLVTARRRAPVPGAAPDAVNDSAGLAPPDAPAPPPDAPGPAASVQSPHD